jgi:hypothetical protein
MPINPNIALGGQPVQQPNILGQMGQMMAIRAASQEIEGSEGVRNALREGMPDDPTTLLQYGKQGRATYESLLKGRKEKVETALKQIEMSSSAFKVIEQDPTLETAQTVFDNLVNMGGMDKNAAAGALAKVMANPTPDNIRKLAKQGIQYGITAAQDLVAQTSRRGQDITAGTTIRGQNMTDARMREQFAFERDKPIGTVTGEDGYLYNRMPDGSVRQVMIGGAPVPAVGNAPPVAGGGVGGGGSVNALAPTAGTSVNALNAPVAQPSASNQPFKPKPTGPMVSINNVEPASETALKQYMKTASDTHTSLKQAPSVLQNIEDAKRLVAGAKGFMGTGGETMLNVTKFLNNRLGTDINTEGVKSAEELNSRLFMGILDNLKKLDSQPSQSQQAAMKEALGNLGTDPNAMNNVLDVFGDILRNKVEIYNQEVTDAEARGVKFPYKPQINLKPKTPASSGDIATDPVIKSLLDKYK